MKRALGLVLVAACGGAPAPVSPPPASPTPAPVASAGNTLRVTPDAPFRQKAPAPDGTVQFVAPKIAEAKLKNGLRVLIVERHDLPIVSARLVVSAGAGDVPDARPGVMSFLGSMLEQGTKKRSALQLSDDFDAIGAHHGAWVDWDSAGVSIRVLSERLDAGLELMADVALAPTFPEAEVERLRTRRITAIQAEKSSPGTIASNTTAAALFGRGHPYGHSITGEEGDAKKLTRAEIVRAYDRLFSPRNAALVVAGDVTAATLLPKLEATFGSWKAKPGAVTRKPPKTPAKAATDKRVVFVDRAGAQSQIQLVRLGVPHSVKDREAFVIANAILGGMFSSRVNMNLREKHSYTYGARSYFAMRHGAGPFLVAAAVFADKTGPAIKEALNEPEGLRRDGPTEEEHPPRDAGALRERLRRRRCRLGPRGPRSPARRVREAFGADRGGHRRGREARRARVLRRRRNDARRRGRPVDRAPAARQARSRRDRRARPVREPTGDWRLREAGDLREAGACSEDEVARQRRGPRAHARRGERSRSSAIRARSNDAARARGMQRLDSSNVGSRPKHRQRWAFRPASIARARRAG